MENFILLIVFWGRIFYEEDIKFVPITFFVFVRSLKEILNFLNQENFWEELRCWIKLIEMRKLNFGKKSFYILLANWEWQIDVMNIFLKKYYLIDFYINSLGNFSETMNLHNFLEICRSFYKFMGQEFLVF